MSQTYMKAVHVENQELFTRNVRENMELRDRFLKKSIRQLFAVQKASGSIKVNEISVGVFNSLEALSVKVVYQVAKQLCRCSH